MADDATFQKFIEQWIGRFGTAQALADAIGMSLSAFSRGVRNAGTLGVENCLRLADVTGEHPSRVLRLAGKDEVATLIERLYSSGISAQGQRLSAPERELIGLWTALNRETQEPLIVILRALSEKHRRSTRTA
jgi:hypothetical protein